MESYFFPRIHVSFWKHFKKSDIGAHIIWIIHNNLVSSGWDYKKPIRFHSIKLFNTQGKKNQSAKPHK